MIERTSFIMPDFEKVAFSGRANVQVIELGVRSCAIESVVVYRDRAEVKRAVPVTLIAGDNEVIIYDLSTCVSENSIRVEGKGSATITDVIYSSKERDEKEESPSGSKERYEAAKDEISQCQVELAHLEFKEQVLKKEKELLAKFANHVSTIHSLKKEDDSLSQLVDHENVIAVMEFFEKYEAKVSDLDGRLTSVTQDKVTVGEKIAVLQANADKLNPNKRKVTSTETIRAVHVGLEAPAETKATLYLSYVVTNASWSSAYDARVFTKDKSMKVQYYGLIKQQTGEDWEDTKISLSTAQPAIGGSAPALSTKIIRFMGLPIFRKPVLTSNRLTRGLYNSSLRSSWESESELEADDLDELSFDVMGSAMPGGAKKESDGLLLRRAAQFSPPSPPPPPKALDVAVAKVTSGLFNATYAIPRATTIPADDTEHKVTVALVDLSPEFHYNSVPRLSPHSFLQAKAKNTSPYTMLAGPANIFLDNNFIAKSELSDVSPNEEFTTSLGVDQSLRITCQPVEAVHNTRTGLLRGSKTTSITYTHKFLVKNTKSHTVNIHLSEQVPLSTDERIKVQVLQPEVRKAEVKCVLVRGHAVLNESNNLEWHISVDSGAEQELKLVYTVEHPTQDHVQGLPKY